MYSRSKRSRRDGSPTSIPYYGWKRWHTIIGLIAAAGAVTWAFSGMLSMEPFPQSEDEDGARRTQQSLMQALRGRAPVEKVAANDPRAGLGQQAVLHGEDLK